ncbi:hypothetical protein BEWA_010310 [Theileria equi strain WA]|uniref:Uncharacterized protein n=1 Tax=Theileria equi strain WA TaxID=1537102 RepID=L0B1A7_THEEQ|nr:hypothetical protein BEWA_010310 [Theileria equi strain WA]AFZ81615.1 hypothetical protein BEWA_010310 [Theileria equi strain WA]|eukprot:XP_004831281.1 hypothetical protein BEWA_010310 [Theileria equi strain WA]
MSERLKCMINARSLHYQCVQTGVRHIYVSCPEFSQYEEIVVHSSIISGMICSFCEF